MSKETLPPVKSLVLDPGFKTDDEDETVAARIIRDLYAKAAEAKWKLTDEAQLPGILTTQVKSALTTLRQTLEAKEDGEVVAYDWAVVPQPAPDDAADDVKRLVTECRAVYTFLADEIKDHIGCKYRYEPHRLPQHEQICFH